MALNNPRIVTIRRVECSVQHPCPAEEIGEAFTKIEKIFYDVHSVHSDAELKPDPTGVIKVRATTDEIIFYFNLDQSVEQIKISSETTKKAKKPTVTRRSDISKQ